jgi:hypothetical protein
MALPNITLVKLQLRLNLHTEGAMISRIAKEVCGD